MLCTVPDKILANWLSDKEYIVASDEGEGMAICAGHWLATNTRATLAISADGFCNTLNCLTSYVIPENIEMDIIISTGRQEPPHKVMSDILNQLLNIIPYDSSRIFIRILQKEKDGNNCFFSR